jgi:very-short-patch-repair endonuclease
MSAVSSTMGLMTASDWPKLSLITTAQLRARGWSAQQIETSVRRGALVRIARGVYVRAQVATAFAARQDGEHLIRAAAAAIRAGRGAVVSHRSAAVLHGIDLIGLPGDVTLTGSAPTGRKGCSGIHVYTTELPAEHMISWCGVLVTTAARTVIDLARTVSFPDGVVAADSCLRKKLASKPQLYDVLATSPRRRGAALAARVVRFATELAESALESIARVAFAEEGLPAPRLQVWIATAEGDVIGRADFCWEEHKTIAEVDGAMKYDDPSRAMAQLRRDKRLREAGYEVVHFTWGDITARPAEVAASIRAAFRAAARKATDPAA